MHCSLSPFFLSINFEEVKDVCWLIEAVVKYYSLHKLHNLFLKHWLQFHPKASFRDLNIENKLKKDIEFPALLIFPLFLFQLGNKNQVHSSMNMLLPVAVLMNV